MRRLVPRDNVGNAVVDVVENENLVLNHLDEPQVHQNLVLNHLGELQVHQIVAHPNHLVEVEDENEVQLNLVHPNQLDVIEDEKILVNHPGRLDENVNQSPSVSRCPKRNRKSVFILIMKLFCFVYVEVSKWLLFSF